MAFDLVSSGMVTAVGYNMPATCAAIRPGLTGFRETQFMFDGDWIRGANVAMPDDPRGRELLVEMAAMAINECLGALPPGRPQDTALLLCLPEAGRPGRLPGLDQSFEQEVRGKLAQWERLGPHCKLYMDGALGGVQALQLVDQVLAQGHADYCVVAGADSYLEANALAAFHEQRRLLTSDNSDGFLPGEAAGALLLSRPTRRDHPLQCLGIGWGREPSSLDSDVPLRGDGLTAAYKAALAEAGLGFEQLDYRITDISGEQTAFKEAALALARTMRVRKEEFDLWHPTDCIGRVGAATVPIVLGVAQRAAALDYAPGPGVLCHFSADDGTRAAVVLRELGKQSHPILT